MIGDMPAVGIGKTIYIGYVGSTHDNTGPTGHWIEFSAQNLRKALLKTTNKIATSGHNCMVFEIMRGNAIREKDVIQIGCCELTEARIRSALEKLSPARKVAHKKQKKLTKQKK